MSLWRREASRRLPEYQRIIASRDVDNPMMLWIELLLEFNNLCKEEPPRLEVIRRFWDYADWCLEQDGGMVSTGAALGFCEHLLDQNETIRILPLIMTRRRYEELKGLLTYLHSNDRYLEGLKAFGK